MWFFVGKAISLLFNMLSSIVSRWQRATENEMAGRHHQCNGHELGQTLEDGGGQGCLACCSPWGHRVRHDLATEQQLGLSELSFQGASIFLFHGCNHCPQWFWSPRKENLLLLPHFPFQFAMKWWDQMPWSWVFKCWVLSQLFHFPLSIWSRVSLAPLHFLPLEWYHLHVLGCWYFFQQSWFQLVLIQPGISHDVFCI